MILSKVDARGVFVTSKEVPDIAEIEAGWRHMDPPGGEGIFMLDGLGWRQVDEEPELPEQPIVNLPAPKRLVSKSLWLEQLYLEEVVTLATLRMEATEVLKTAPTTLREIKLRYFAAFLEHFSNLGDYIDLESQKVLEGLELFRDLAGITTERMFALLEFER